METVDSITNPFITKTVAETSEIQMNQANKINGVEIIPDKNRYSSGATKAKTVIAAITKTTKCRLPTS